MLSLSNQCAGSLLSSAQQRWSQVSTLLYLSSGRAYITIIVDRNAIPQSHTVLDTSFDSPALSSTCVNPQIRHYHHHTNRRHRRHRCHPHTHGHSRHHQWQTCHRDCRDRTVNIEMSIPLLLPFTSLHISSRHRLSLFLCFPCSLSDLFYLSISSLFLFFCFFGRRRQLPPSIE